MERRDYISVVTEEDRIRRTEELAKQDEIDAKKAEKAKHDNNFVKDFRDSLPAKVALQKDNQWALAIFEFLKVHMDYSNFVVCSNTVFMEQFGISESTVTRAIAALKKHNFIKVAKTGTSNVYYVNAEIAWSSWANQKKYAEFSAKVIVSESEQKDARIAKRKVKEQTKKAKKTVQPIEDVRPINEEESI